MKGQGGEAEGGLARALLSFLTLAWVVPTHQLRRMQEMLQKMKQQMQDQ